MLSTSRGLVPREGLDSLLMKMGHTSLLAKPRHGLQAGKSGDPRSQNADTQSLGQVGSQDYVKFYFIKYDYNSKDSHQDDVDPEEEELESS